MTADRLDARLRQLARLSAAWMDSEEGRRDAARRAQLARRNAVVDNSPEALDARLQRMAGASALCMELSRSAGAKRMQDRGPAQ